MDEPRVGGPEDIYCRNCGQSRIAYVAGGKIQECWVEDFTEDGAPTAAQLRHRWPEHEHYWIDAPDDETGWFCPVCGLAEYPWRDIPEDADR